MALITQVRGDSGYLASVLPPRGAPRLDASLRMRAESCAKKLSQVRALRKRAGRKGAPKEGERRKSNKGSGAHSASMYDADGERERERERETEGRACEYTPVRIARFRIARFCSGAGRPWHPYLWQAVASTWARFSRGWAQKDGNLAHGTSFCCPRMSSASGLRYGARELSPPPPTRGARWSEPARKRGVPRLGSWARARLPGGGSSSSVPHESLVGMITMSTQRRPRVFAAPVEKRGSFADAVADGCFNVEISCSLCSTRA